MSDYELETKDTTPIRNNNKNNSYIGDDSVGTNSITMERRSGRMENSFVSRITSPKNTSSKVTNTFTIDNSATRRNRIAVSRMRIDTDVGSSNPMDIVDSSHKQKRGSPIEGLHSPRLLFSASAPRSHMLIRADSTNSHEMNDRLVFPLSDIQSRQERFRRGSYSKSTEYLFRNTEPFNFEFMPECECTTFTKLKKAYQHSQLELDEVRMRNLILENKISNLQSKLFRFKKHRSNSVDGDSVGDTSSSISRISHISSLRTIPSVVQRSVINRYNGSFRRYNKKTPSRSISSEGDLDRPEISLQEEHFIRKTNSSFDNTTSVAAQDDELDRLVPVEEDSMDVLSKQVTSRRYSLAQERKATLNPDTSIKSLQPLPMLNENVEKPTKDSATLEVQNNTMCLPRGGVYVFTKSGPVQFGIPPETIKDVMEMGLDVPTRYVVPKERFNLRHGVNTCEVEFPAYYNFFLAKRSVNIICTKEEMDIVKKVVDETLEGPEPSQLYVDSEYRNTEAFNDTIFCRSNHDSRFEYDARPNHKLEIDFFKQPRGGREIRTDTLVSFTHFETLDINLGTRFPGIHVNDKGGQVSVADLGKNLFIINTETAYIVVEDGIEIARIHSFLPSFIPSNSISQSAIPKYLAEPINFGITVLGSSHGFDPHGSTSGFVIWIHKKGIMVDPPPNATDILQEAGIVPSMINGIILTHCHADHDAGTFQKILKEGRITLITTKTIFDSFIRKYSLISGFTDTFLLKLFETRLVNIGEPIHWNGGTLRFFYSLHALPCVGFEAFVGNKSFVYSSDTYYDPKGLEKLCEEGFLSEKRKQALMDFPWDYDVVLHEAGIAPIHTPTDALNALPEHVRKNLYVIHITEAKAKEAGLRLARAGVENSIIIDADEEQYITAASILQVLRATDFARSFTIQQASELLQMCAVCHYKAGEYVCKDGDDANHFYIILNGFCCVEVNDVDEHPSLKSFGPGDYLGELSLLRGHRRSAAIRALTSLSLILLDELSFRYLLSSIPGLQDRMERLSQIRCSLSWKAIESNSVFCRLGSTQRSNLQAIMMKEEIDTGTELWKMDQPIRRAYLIGGGALTFSEMDELEVPFTEGAFLCDIACMLNTRAIDEGESPDGHITARASLVATEPSLVYSIDADDIIEYLDLNPGIFINLIDSLVIE